MLTALVFFGLGGFEGAFVESLRLHLLDLVPWCVAGGVGALAGYKLAGRGVPEA
jgi:hypothetical protein